MPRLKVLKDGHFRLEGWNAGEIIEIDDNAAAGPLALGVVELLDEPKKKAAKKKPAAKKTATKKK